VASSSSVSASRALFVLLLLALSPHVAEAQRSLVASHPGGWWDEQPLAPLPIHGPDASHRAGGGISDGASAPRSEAESMRPISVRSPLAVPNAGFPLFALDEQPSATDYAESTASRPETTTPTVASMPSARTGTVQRRAETLYYDIEGLSRMDLAAALREHGPTIHGRQFFGLTEWEMSAGYRPVEGESGCAIDDLTIEVSVTTHLPRWSRAAAAPSSLRSAWDRFVAALDQHERGHRVLAERAAETVRHRLLVLSAPTCDRLDVRARQEMSVVMQEYERRQLAYDAETGHGRTQGAVWPPAHSHHLSARRSR
jgi:predicted secreted Zn-dependent protease